MAHPRERFCRRTNLADISYTHRVIANFIPNFVAMATGVDRRKMRLAAFDGTSSKTPLWTHKSRRYLLHRASYSQFCPKFRCHGNGNRWAENAIGSIRWHILENPAVNAQTSQISLTHTELLPIFSQISLPWQRGSFGEKYDWEHSITHPRKPPYGRTNLADISYTHRVIANFVQKFRCHSIGGRSAENAIGSIRWHLLENPPVDAQISQISLTHTEL